MRRVVITGMGPVTPIAVGNKAFHQAQLEAKNGIRRIQRFDASSHPVKIAGEVDIDFSSWLEAKEQKRMDRFSQLAMVAAALALQESGLELGRLETSRAGVIVGSGVGGMSTWETQAEQFVARGPSRIHPFVIPMLMVNSASAQIAIRYGLKGPISAVATACSSGLEAIGQAFRAIQHGEAEVMLTGGAEASVTPMTVGAFGVMRALSTRNEAPEQASRPFDRSRDGFVIGEGAALLVLEELEHAKARGAYIYAELLGFGRSADAHHMAEPHPSGDGALRAMQGALKEARLNPNQIGYIQAHGTSTPLGDAAEVKAIERGFGEYARKVWVSSSKSMVGHTIGAAGAIGVTATAQAICSGIVPPNRNLEEPDFELNLVRTPERTRPQFALVNAFAFGGLNASLAMGRFGG